MSPPSLDELVEFALGVTREAGENALRFFQTNLQVETKADKSPVTIADRECELFLRRRIEERFPEHGILGEEFGPVRDQARWRWMLDPIDGTETFIRGVSLWGVLMGLQQDEEPVLGVAHFPALGETIWAWRGGGAWWDGKRAAVSRVARLADATLLMTDVRGFAAVGFQAGYERLRAATKFERTWGDCYGHALVATGRAEIMLDPILSPWDACALLPIIEEARGRFADWTGQRTILGGNAVSTNGLLFAAVVKLLREG